MLRLHSGMPCAPVTSGAERRKFATEVYAKLFVQGDQMGRVQSHQRINFDKWAVEWNEHCAKIETGLAEWEAVYRKTSQQLENHYEKFKGFANANNTMNLLGQRDAALRSGLREAEGGASFAGLVGSVVPPPVPGRRSGAGIGVCGGSEGGGAAGGAGVSAGVAEMLDFSGGGGQFDAPQPKPKKPKGPPRGPQICFHCGHRRQEGAYQEAHPAPRRRGEWPQCNVPPEKHRPEICRTGKARADGKRSWSRCDCEKCTVGSTGLIVA